MKETFLVSLVIPVYNESKTIAKLISTINQQSFFPDEIILVDAGSIDNTLELIKEICGNDQRFRIIEAGQAMPGRGRNIGAKLAANEWIAFTDAGIKLDRYWLENLVKKARENVDTDIVYGNYAPQINNLFDKCATIAYVPPQRPTGIRGKFIASCILKKKVWEKAGGFPDWRATEDLVFMEKVEQQGAVVMNAPEAMVYWELRSGLVATYKRFDLYSMHNVLAGRQAYWHYGVAWQYLFMLAIVLLSIFYSWYWFLLLPVWISVRVMKRLVLHRNEFGLKSIINPVIFFKVMIITLVIDAATFSGWIKAFFKKKEYRRISLQQ